MANECNRNIVEKYICHKLSKRGFAFGFDDVRDEEADNNGSIVVPAPTLVRRCREASTGPDSESPPQLCRRIPQPDPAVEIHRVLREAGDELERLYQPDFTEMSRQLYLTSTTAQRRFSEVIDELFRDGVNWGRIIAFFEFGGTVCVECASKQEMTSQVDNIAEWMTEYLNGPLSSWIQDNGGWMCPLRTTAPTLDMFGLTYELL
ncbi:Apoptosis regulator Bcl-2 [Dissostichus eleginoides]|uniref:Apoptosis regulator Bcl-2 n=1 Tax=Dissostichus eleginoides TaxID=100907 RepID=A0AAD9B843_DISEL|nr:Apoptosis regulator Bcl-2 [Dissostichus eleginoides]